MNFDCLSPKEIRDRYRWADDKRYILEVLGDLTCCSAEDVALFLNVDCPPRRPEYHYIPVTARKAPVRINPALMRPLYDKGLTDGEIAAEIGCTRTTVGKWRRKEGLALNVKPAFYANDREELKRLYKLGYTDRQIAEALHITKNTVTGWRHRRGLPVNRDVRAKGCAV